MNEDTGVIVVADTEQITFFVNGENKYLVKERQMNKKDSPLYLNELFRNTLGYQCFALYIRYKKKEENNLEETEVSQKIKDASEGLAMTVFAVTTRISKIIQQNTKPKNLGEE